MNNSFSRLIDGMTATLRREVLTRLDDDYARGQVFGVINLLDTFRSRADWSAGFLQDQVEAQRAALLEADGLARAAGLPAPLPAEPAPGAPLGTSVPSARQGGIEALLAQRDAGNRSIARWLDWLDAAPPSTPAAARDAIETALRAAMRAEVDLELKASPRPLFAEMSSGRER